VRTAEACGQLGAKRPRGADGICARAPRHRADCAKPPMCWTSQCRHRHAAADGLVAGLSDGDLLHRRCALALGGPMNPRRDPCADGRDVSPAPAAAPLAVIAPQPLPITYTLPGLAQ